MGLRGRRDPGHAWQRRQLLTSPANRFKLQTTWFKLFLHEIDWLYAQNHRIYLLLLHRHSFCAQRKLGFQKFSEIRIDCTVITIILYVTVMITQLSFSNSSRQRYPVFHWVFLSESHTSAKSKCGSDLFLSPFPSKCNLVEISDSAPPAPLVKEVTKRFSTPDAAPVSTEPAWLALAKRKAKAWSDCPQIIK